MNTPSLPTETATLPPAKPLAPSITEMPPATGVVLSVTLVGSPICGGAPPLVSNSKKRHCHQLMSSFHGARVCTKARLRQRAKRADGRARPRDAPDGPAGRQPCRSYFSRGSCAREPRARGRRPCGRRSAWGSCWWHRRAQRPRTVGPNGGAASATAAADETEPADTEAPATEAAGAPRAPTRRCDFETTSAMRSSSSEARFSLDGRHLPTLLTSAARGQDYVIFTGPLTPGRHVITSHLALSGASRSIFTYMKGYTFDARQHARAERRRRAARPARPSSASATRASTCRSRSSLKVEMEQRHGRRSDARAERLDRAHRRGADLATGDRRDESSTRGARFAVGSVCHMRDDAAPGS